MLLDVDDFKIIEITYGKVVFSKIDQAVVVTGRDADEVAALFPNDRDVVYNADYESGMTSSIQAGVRYAKPDHAYMICLGDMIWLNEKHYDAIITRAKDAIATDEKAIVVPRVNGRPGNPVIFSNHYRKAILDHNSPNGCKEIVQQNRRHLVYLDSRMQAYLKDIDTPQDLDHLKK